MNFSTPMSSPEELPTGHLFTVMPFPPFQPDSDGYAEAVKITNKFNKLIEKVKNASFDEGLVRAVAASKSYVNRLDKRAADLPYTEDEGDALWVTYCDARAFINSVCYPHKSLKIRPDARDRLLTRRYTLPAADAADVRVGLHIAYLGLVHVFLPREVRDDQA